MKSIYRRFAVGCATLVLAFHLTAGMVLSSLPVSLPAVAGIAVIATLPVVVGCTKDQLVASAEDVLDVVTDEVVMAALRNISPFALMKLTNLIQPAKDLVAAIKASLGAKAAELIKAIFPVINDIAATHLAGNVKALGVLALANVALHFLLNRLPGAAVQAAKAQGGSTAAEASILESFKNERAWGCDYHASDKRCKK